VTQPFSLRLDPETRARLEEEPRRLDRPASQVAQRAIACYLDAQQALRDQIDAAAAEADRGVFVSSAAVNAWLDGWRTDRQTPPPAPDILPDASR
jgi:predicted transcriptional regulator